MAEREVGAGVVEVARPAPERPASAPAEAAAQATGSQPPRLPALTGLRIVAALAVYFSHLGPPHNAPRALRAFIESGYMGVTLFFTLSGFVLALNYFDRLSRPNVRGIWDYSVARFARVYPLYVLILLYLLVRRHAFGESTAGWWEHIVAVQAWSPNVVEAYKFNGPAWSVSVEFFLYACFPFLAVMLARLRSPRALLVAAVLMLAAMTGLTAWFAATGRGSLPWLDPGSAHRWLYRTPVTRLGDFVLGILAARLYFQLRAGRGWARAGGALAVLAVVATIALMAWPADVFNVWSWDLLYLLPAVLVILGLALAPDSRLARALSTPLMVLLGESSYAFYLVHQWALGFFGAGRWAVGTSVTTVLYEGMTLGAIICLAIGLHVAVERPARRYIRRVAAPGKRASGQWHGPREVLP